MIEEQEADLWWGSYSGWTMWPSFLACLLLTAASGWLTWHFVERDWLQLAFFGVGTALWLVQFLRLGRRVFGYSYRLTNRRLFRDTGYSRPNRFNMDLKSIVHVQVRRNSFEKMVNVGRVIIRQADPKHPPIALEGVSQPFTVAHMIREAVRKTQEVKQDEPAQDAPVQAEPVQ